MVVLKRQYDKFVKSCGKAMREEEVITAYQRLLGAEEWPRPFGCDGVYGNVLFEFKFDTDFSSRWPEVLAQACYYLHRILTIGVYKGERVGVPVAIAICDRNEVALVKTDDVVAICLDMTYDWSLPPSSPDLDIVSAVESLDMFIHRVTDEASVGAFLSALTNVGNGVTIARQVITKDNFDLIFEVWKPRFAGELGAQEAAGAFLSDLQMQVMVDRDAGEVLFKVEDGSAIRGVRVRVPVGEYEAFWSTYSRPPSNDEMAAIIARKDRLVAMQVRRMTGEFLTPLDIAGLGIEYIQKNIPDCMEWNWWDPCCGTGNLTWGLPSMPGRLFLSTLNQEDVDIVRGNGQPGLVFRHDFLNEVEEALPEALRKRLVKGSKWIFYMNPPYAAGTELTAVRGGVKDKAGVSDTIVGADMKRNKLGHGCQNLQSQFLWRVKQLTEIFGLQSVVANYGKAIDVTGGGYECFREAWTKTFTFVDGFVFCCSEFEGTAGCWPVVMAIRRSR
jgi:hypothetical protein